MIKPSLYASVIAGLIIAVTLFNRGSFEDANIETGTLTERNNASIKKIATNNNSAKKSSPSSKQVDTLPAVIATLSADDVLRKAQVTKEAIKKYKKARNLYLADPTMDAAEQQQLIAQLDKVVFGDTAQDYELSDEDLDDQARYREIIVDFQHDTQSIKTNTSLNRQQKEAEIRQLLSEFIADIDS